MVVNSRHGRAGHMAHRLFGSGVLKISFVYCSVEDLPNAAFASLSTLIFGVGVGVGVGVRVGVTFLAVCVTSQRTRILCNHYTMSRVNSDITLSSIRKQWLRSRFALFRSTAVSLSMILQHNHGSLGTIHRCCVD